APWAQQVHELARQGPGGAGPGAGPGAGTGGGTAGGGVVAVPGQQGEPAGVVPWRPPVNDPFASMVQEQGRPAGLGRRLAARLLDTMVVLAVTGVAAVPLGTAAYRHLKDKVDEARQTGETVTVWLIDGTTGVQLAIVLGVALVAGLLYEVLPTAKWGRTLGKKLFGLRVVDIESQLAPGFGPSLRRWLTHTVLDALVVGVVGLVWCMVDRPWRQCWHDKAARTFVARQ
ncbi:RDD family protein, partial [Streptomyces sp. SID13666]|uniref:RDD family protein n=1 Tax=Streptomyces sp. SID13666 TaxID=2706054 RepID=UPI001943579E